MKGLREIRETGVIPDTVMDIIHQLADKDPNNIRNRLRKAGINDGELLNSVLSVSGVVSPDIFLLEGRAYFRMCISLTTESFNDLKQPLNKILDEISE